jgi:hypothetical protein
LPGVNAKERVPAPPVAEVSVGASGAVAEALITKLLETFWAGA